MVIVVDQPVAAGDHLAAAATPASGENNVPTPFGAECGVYRCWFSWFMPASPQLSLVSPIDALLTRVTPQIVRIADAREFDPIHLVERFEMLLN